MAQVWLVLRVYALWNRDRRIFAILISAYTTNAVTSLTITGLSMGVSLCVCRKHRHTFMNDI